MTAPRGPDVDYAEPADVPRSRREPTPRVEGAPWDGPGRTRVKLGCWAGAGVLALGLALPLLRPAETGAGSPEEAVDRLLQGIVDVDPGAVLGAVDPEETADPVRARAAYDRLSTRLLRVGDEVPAEVSTVLLGTEAELGDGGDLRALADLAALDLELTDLDLAAEPVASGPVRVRVVGGTIDVVLDPERLPSGGSGGSGGTTTYSMPLAEGWRADGWPVPEPFLTTVQRDGRWYVSLETSGDDLLGTAW